ncbi:MAG: pyruvate dehydrogenase [Chloroflexi bacterium]|nr:MAG: pyruvate dehydrogenase [Chloroflexota bacterium]
MATQHAEDDITYGLIESFPHPNVEQPTLAPEYLAVLDTIQKRILWLSTLIIHHANHVRPNVDDTKVGGHQASSASVVSILTALYFHALRRGDRVSIKPHASPAFHATQYLLGELPKHYLTTLRDYKGLQAYPSRTKDPDPVDFSTGSVGLGAVAPLFAALSHRYTREHFGEVTSNRFIALIGDAELDEGNIWEALIEEALAHVGNVVWIVDNNRQSLDRVIPGIRAARLKRLFAVSGWRVLEVKYGSRLREAFARPGGDALRQAIDDMPNEEYQTLIRLDGAELRRRLVDRQRGDEIARVVADVSDAELPGLIANLAGHDLGDLIAVIDEALAPSDRPTVIFAYTIKGWGLPFAGDALNHSALLNPNQIDPVRASIGIAEGDEWERFAPDSPEGKLAAEAWERLYGGDACPPPAVQAEMIPEHLGHARLATTSTQEALGRLLTRLADLPEVGKRIVTAAPDVSVSTNLGGWINKVGVFAAQEAPTWDSGPRLLRWEPKPSGQHIELGISEMNLFMLLGQLGLSHEMSGQLLFPIGTVYDPFVLRGLDAFIYGIYTHSKFIIAGTPSGISLSPEGGAHQSTVTPSLCLELPRLRAWEPCFAQELEWILLDALRQCCDREHGLASYLRLSTKPIKQALMEPAQARLGQDELRRQVLRGGYRLIDARHDAPGVDLRDTVQIVTSGTMVPEALDAARLLHEEGVAANVLNLTSAQLLFKEWQAQQRWAMGIDSAPPPQPHLDTLVPPDERHAPIVAVLDGASHALAWLGSVHGAQVISLGVDDFGQSGSRADLYHHYGIDAEHIASAAFATLDRR